MRAASLMAMDAESSSGEEGAFFEAAVKPAWKRKKWPEGGVCGGSGDQDSKLRWRRREDGILE